MREARSSYGILRREYYGDFPEHQGIRPSYDPIDGLPYIVNTIDWVLRRVSSTGLFPPRTT